MSDLPAPPASSFPPSTPLSASDTAPRSAPEPFDPRHPLGKLALSLSGGGYRAAAFHLGTLRMLDRVGLLPSVVGLSTVSGGTICGMAWVVSMIEGKPFSDFHGRFSRYLMSNNVIGEALEGLRSERESGQWASLIRAAADVYARDDFLGDRRFAEVEDAQGLQLEETIFNSTEFHTGLDFRFRRTGNPRGFLGSSSYRLPRKVARHIRLADIVAASSCFPGGFEPLVFPQQFRWPAQYPLQSALDDLGEKFAGGLPLMDGGVYDNQGVESLLTALRETSATTLIVSDVSARNKQMYDVPRVPASRGVITLQWVWRLALLLLVLALVSGGVLLWHGWVAARDGDWRPLDYLLYWVPGLLSAGVGIGLWWARRRLREGNRMLETSVDVEAWPSLRRLTVPEFTQMLVLRATSVLALTSSVFMARIRRMVFGLVWNDPAYEGKRVANLIYSMAKPDAPLFERFPWLRPNGEMVKLAETAEAMGTTLWFNEPAEFHMLQRAGEATLCFVLLKLIVEHRSARYETPDSDLYDIYTRLREQWDGFNGAVAAAAPAAPRVPRRSGPSIWGT
ncbi:MAG TPA: patatin-like phospholipase family protein [Longimicrobium sp.]|jgi:predicted acylesterase/phospholipase RssA|uniref:patatin-like phospholipase family protein n=1 Tax=Longimicrobium sp. TaxID=2029185 RepID=UPI002ED96906